MVQFQVLLFAAARDAIGSDSIEIELALPNSAGEVMRVIANEYPALATLIPSCRLAVNQVYVTRDFSIADAAELAIIPPVSGG